MSTRAPISVVIPTLNAAAALPQTLARIMEGVDAGLIRELIISDGGSCDDVRQLADEVGASFIEGPAGRSGQIARGCAAAQGAWLLIVEADTWLPEGWSGEATAHLSQPHQGLVFSVQFRGQSPIWRVAAKWVNTRTRWFGLSDANQGLLVRKDLLAQAGGYPELAQKEDVAQAHALKGQIHLSPLCVQIDSKHFQTSGWLSREAQTLWRAFRSSKSVDRERPHREHP